MKTLPLLSLLVILSSVVPATAESPSQRIADLKANMAASKAILHHYQWVETTTVSVNGDVKSTKQQLCYYGADGSLQKQDLSDEQAPSGGLLFRRLRERKKEELTDYMMAAIDLVKSYVPPNSERIEAAKDAGNISFTPEPGHHLRLVISNYKLQGDRYSIDIDLNSNRPDHLGISTYLYGDPSQSVTMSASMGTLDSGATFPANITLNAPAHNLTVTVHNGGYRPNNN